MQNFKKRYPEFALYPESLSSINGISYFIALRNNVKFIVLHEKDFRFFPALENVKMLQDRFPFLKARACGTRKSFGFGDRLGLAAPGHIRALKKHCFFPILAQQSPRELKRTGRSFREVMDSAVLGSFQEGYKEGFGADADHIKKTEDLQEAADAGFSFFTIDPSDKVYRPETLPVLKKKGILSHHMHETGKLYAGKKYHAGGKKHEFNEETLSLLILTYAESLDHVEKCYRFLKNRLSFFDFEVSFDETSLPTTPLAHIFIAEELEKRGVVFQSLALKFPGKFEKGIDYRGDVNLLERELEIHDEIRKKMGNYKLSLHSGSDKFSIYPVFKKILGEKIHVKTSGTSWIESVRVIAERDFPFFLEVMDGCIADFEKNAASYEISAHTDMLQRKKLENREIEELFSDMNIRQVLHIGYGTVLASKSGEGKYLYRDRFFEILNENEEFYYNMLSSHLGKHLNLLQ